MPHRNRQPETTGSEINWSKFGKRLDQMLLTIEPFAVLGPNDIGRLGDQLIVKSLQAENTLTKLRWGNTHIAEEGAALELLQAIAYHFGVGGPPEYPSYIEVPARAIDTVRAAIAQRVMSQGFVDAWAELNRLWGLYAGLQMREAAVEGNMRRGLMGKAGQSTKLQQHWYARVVQRYAKSFKPKAREKLDERIGALCQDIAERRIKPPEGRITFFTKMLMKDEDDGHLGSILKSTYRDLTESEIRDLLNDSTIGLEALPPTDLDLYVKK